MTILEFELEIGSNGPEEYLFKGSPFTGTAVELDDSGRVIYQCEFNDGVKDGVERSYYRNGNLESELTYKKNFTHGWDREWHENGALRREAYRQYAEVMSEKRWEPDGRMTIDFHIDPDSWHYKTYLSYKEKWPDW